MTRYRLEALYSVPRVVCYLTLRLSCKTEKVTLSDSFKVVFFLKCKKLGKAVYIAVYDWILKISPITGTQKFASCSSF